MTARAVRYEVTASHIAQGEPGDSDMDPLAICIRETLPVSADTGERLISVAVEPLSDDEDAFAAVMWAPGAGAPVEKALITGEEARRCALYDATGEMEPYVITLYWETAEMPGSAGLAAEEGTGKEEDDKEEEGSHVSAHGQDAHEG
jgi:hypothetical protein